MRVIITGGGTGGHIYPALAIADWLKNNDKQVEILYVGTERGLESKIVPEKGYSFATIPVEGLPRKLSPQLLKAGLRAVEGGTKALKIVKEFQPDIVIGTGGYVCGPVVMAAKVLGKPCVIHEQNALPGVTNKLLAKVVDKVMLTFEDSKKYFANQSKTVMTGLPVRSEIMNVTREEGIKQLQLNPELLTLLVAGGSRGAKSINDGMIKSYSTLASIEDLQIVHVTGEAGYEQVKKQLEKLDLSPQQREKIHIKPYLHNMEYALAVADICLARAGATFIAEITAKGIPTILVPYPYASENHQEFNARALVAQHAAVMILDKDLDQYSLVEEVNKLIKDKSYRQQMAENARNAGNLHALEDIGKVIRQLS